MEDVRIRNSEFTSVGDMHDSVPSIVLYSPDMDFCISLRLLFQNRYVVRTTTDPQMLLLMVNDFQPGLVIVDGLPTARMKLWLEKIKQGNSSVHIMFFYVPSFNDRAARQYIQNTVDAAFSKPLDLEEVTNKINQLVAEHSL